MRHCDFQLLVKKEKKKSNFEIELERIFGATGINNLGEKLIQNKIGIHGISIVVRSKS